MLKHFLAFGTITLSLNVTSVDNINQFDKEAYLNLNQQYSFNSQEIIKKESAFDTLFTEVLHSMRNELGATNSDNIDQLGNRISDNLKNKVVNNSFDTAEEFINKTANEFVNNDNKIGGGKTLISLNKTVDGSLTYSVETIQPLTKLTKKSSHLTFVQAKFESGDDYLEDPNNINIGIGQRYLLNGNRTIVGVNLFNDYQTVTDRQRISLGFEFQRANFTANFNQYFAISDKVVVDDYIEEVLSGLDFRVTGQVPYLPWAKVKASGYIWNKTDTEGSEDITGTILGVEMKLNPSISIEVGFEDSSATELETYAKLNAHLPLRKIDTLNKLYSKKAFSDSNIIALSDLNTVERSSIIRIEKILDGGNVSGGVYSATTEGATCTLYNSSGVAINRGVGKTTATGSFDLSKVIIPNGLVSMECVGGIYTDEATGQEINPAPTLHAATIYSGAEDLVLIASPLSEIAYQLANDIGLENYIDS
jgi:hypothetical protein